MHQTYLPKRYVVSALAFLGFVVMFYLRTNLSIAVVAMTDGRNRTTENETYFEEAEFDWDSKETGIILSCFSYGYFMAPIGGLLAHKFGGATVFGFGILITAFFTILSPILFRFNFYIFITARILEGALEAFSMAASAELFARWSPPEERARIITYSHTGIFLGTALNYPISGFVAHHFGWEYIFYVSGVVTIFWYIFWCLIVSNDPSQDKNITTTEQLYLKEKITYMGNEEKVIYPWKSIITSRPLWAYALHKFAHAWSFAFTIFCLPLYIKDLHEVDLKKIGIIASVPNFCSLISQPVAATALDYLRARKILTSTQIHKLFTCGSYVFAAILFAVVQSWTHFMATIIIFSTFRFVVGFSETSYNVLPVDVAPRYASLIAGIGSAFYSMGTLLSPILIGFIVTDHKHAQWNTYFSILSAINVFGGIVFFLFGSGELQPWAVPVKKENSTVKQEPSSPAVEEGRY